MIRFMRSTSTGSKSAKWQTTSRVLQRPGIGRAMSCSRVIPATALRSAAAPARYWSASSDGVGMGAPVPGSEFQVETTEVRLLYRTARLVFRLGTWNLEPGTYRLSTPFQFGPQVGDLPESDVVGCVRVVVQRAGVAHHELQ